MYLFSISTDEHVLLKMFKKMYAFLELKDM